MDITQFIVASRDKALLYGDHNTYRSQLAHRLLNCRKRLRVATRHRGKYNHNANKIKPEQVAEDVNYARLQLLTAERAYAQAMAMKAAHTANKKGITGHTRSHIVSRLDKAAKYAEALVLALDDDRSGAGAVDRLEARAYAALLRGAAAFEKQSWPLCLANYAAVWAVYRALSSTSPARADVFRDLLTETIEPSLRYAAYQLKMPRSKPLPIIAREALLSATGGAKAAAVAATPDTASLVAAVNELDPSVLQPPTTATAAEAAPEAAPMAAGTAVAAAAAAGGGGVVASTRTLTWRARAVTIEDAAIASAWAALDVAKARLAAQLDEKTKAAGGGGARGSGRRSMAPKDMAAAYDDVLTASQDTVDATKAALDDLRNEGVPPSDPSMQVLYVARTAAHYELISDRIGRNRVLTGPHDGALVHLDAAYKKRKMASKKKTTTATAAAAAAPRPEAPGRFLARLKEKVVLYDGTLQSLETVKELPGVAADAALAAQLDATAQYFVALKSLAIARSHTVAGQAANALALVKHAYDQCTAAAPVLTQADKNSGSGSDAPATALRSLHVTAADVQFLLDLLQTELQRARALVDIANSNKKNNGESSSSPSSSSLSVRPPPLAETLAEYPPGPVDLDNIVAYPPRLEAMPVKPIFLDIAWNYIAYPSRAAGGGGGGSGSVAAASAATVKSGLVTAAANAAQHASAQPEQQQQKRGWFGFKR
ncbi:signal recognition particle [Niveomyces insectorum RCEF 264]|uniref:Signal recognition particle subunit SRP68 n=1 Tax=Niveomyces insectorum RCEF 264 TaxID=1081102 RepID=A0A167PFT7_9HYPO|nr:signal recognition particle [Niveomyces insectorum RCEF 264]